MPGEGWQHVATAGTAWGGGLGGGAVRERGSGRRNHSDSLHSHGSELHVEGGGVAGKTAARPAHRARYIV